MLVVPSTIQADATVSSAAQKDGRHQFALVARRGVWQEIAQAIDDQLLDLTHELAPMGEQGWGLADRAGRADELGRGFLAQRKNCPGDIHDCHDRIELPVPDVFGSTPTDEARFVINVAPVAMGVHPRPHLRSDGFPNEMICFSIPRLKSRSALRSARSKSSAPTQN
jgi:hypothetical protein